MRGVENGCIRVHERAEVFIGSASQYCVLKEEHAFVFSCRSYAPVLALSWRHRRRSSARALAVSSGSSAPTYIDEKHQS